MLTGAAMAFEPLFFVSETKGTCSMIPAGMEAPQPVEVNRAYPYGTRLQTGIDGEITLRFSERNECVMRTNTTVSLAADAANEHWKSVRVDSGRVDVRLEPKFNEKNANRVTIETASSVGEPSVGGEFTCVVTRGQDDITSEFATAKGEMRLYDNLLFELPALKAENRAEIAISADKQYTRLRILKGTLLVDLKNVTDIDGSPKVVKTQTDTVMKLWRKSTPEGVWTVTVLVIAPNGALVESMNYSVR